MMTHRFQCIVGHRDGQIRFVFDVHMTEAVEARLIEADFYADDPPQGKHYELEVIEPNLWDQRQRGPIHIHLVPGTQRRFVCYKGALARLEDMYAVMMHWCVGTAYTMKTGQDFAELTQQGDDLYNYLETEHGLMLIDLVDG